MGLDGHIFAGDADPTAPTLHKADASVILPPVTDPSYIDILRDFCRKNEVRLVIPLIDPELEVLASAKEVLQQDGILAMVSDKSVIAKVQDKLQTAVLFSEVGLRTPRTIPVKRGDGRSQHVARGNSCELIEVLGLPLVLKPRYGSSSKGVFVCSTPESVEGALRELQGEYVAQQYVDGVEVTSDVFGDGRGNVLSLVPRKRLKVRAGEVERGVTVADELFREDLLRLSEHLKPFGAINVQCFVSEHGPVYTEINGRFGGGYPLAHAAGARFPELIIRMALGEEPAPSLGQYEIGVVMSRYDEAIYTRASLLPNGDQLLHLPRNAPR